MMRFLKKKRGRAGFTLVELLVTITIIGVISITTGAIVISSMNTFRRQKDVMGAVDTKELVCITLKDHLRKRLEIGLVTQNLAPTPMGNDIDPTVNEGTIDANSSYVLDNRLEKYHMIFSEGGRIYTFTSNIDGKYYVNKSIASVDIEQPVVPASVEEMEALVGGSIDETYCRRPFMADELYDGYYVDLKFMPIYTNAQGRYRDLQVRVTVYDDPSMTEEHQVAKGTETFHMLNIENRQMSIRFQNDVVADAPAVIDTQPEAIAAPQTGGFKFCYFI